LDRKDRMSMAVGLEVRVPFCDHRLVQYVFNAPWSLKTFDGREKSLLRAATRDVLPESVANRKKSGYPGTFDPTYVAAIQSQGADLLRAGHPAVELVSRERLTEATTQPSADLSQQQRMLLERTLDLGVWFDIHHPTVKV
jgi:asparagine synthase (glutamine-hydrolysing)